MHESESPWPPAYTLRRSARARRIRLSIRPLAGLVVVIPPGAEESDALDALERHKDWVLRHLPASGPQGAPPRLPEEMLLHGGLTKIGVEWTRSALAAVRPGRLAQGRTPDHSPVCRLKDGDEQARRTGLKTWLAEYARAWLGERLTALAECHGFTRPSLRVGWQKTRWGSFSSREPGGIMRLNVKLVFLPERLANAVILHELCHGVHMDHGPAFKALLASLNPRVKEDDKELNRPSRWLPSWLGAVSK